MTTKTYKVEKATYRRREFVSAATDCTTAYAIFAATVNGFCCAGYTRATDELDKHLPNGVEILRKGRETVAFQVVSRE